MSLRRDPIQDRSDDQRHLETPMRLLPKRHDGAPATWTPLALQCGGLTAVVRCPSCGEGFDLYDYEIGSDGSVLTSVICPHGCGYNEIVKLDGWKESE